MKVGAGWNIYTAMADASVPKNPGPLPNGLMARDASGRLWWYGQKDPWTPGTRSLVGAGWNIYTLLF